MGIKFYQRYLTARVASNFLMLSLLTVSIVGGVAFFRAREALKKAAFDRLSVAATLKEEEISRWFIDREQDFFLVTQFPEVKLQLQSLLNGEASQQESQKAYQILSQYLHDFVQVKPNFSEIFILDRRNRIAISTNSANEGEYEVAGNFTYFDFAQIDLGQGFTPIFYVSPVTGKPAVTLAAPIQDRSGSRIGVVLAHLNLDRIDQIIRERTGLGESGETYLIGSLVTENSFISGNENRTEELISGVNSPGIDAAMQGFRGFGLYRNYQQIPVIGVYRWLDDLGIALLVEMEQAEAFAPARQLAATILLVGLVAAGVLSLGAYLLARQITRPILAIADTATQLAAGDLEQIAPVLTEDEVGLLARNFNQMAKQLKESFASLEAKNSELQRLDRLKDEFLANTSHELRTPLYGAIGIAESMLDGATGELTEIQRQNLLTIVASGRRLANLVNDILDFSKLRHQDIELQIKAVGVREIVEVVLTLSRSLLGKKNLQLINNVDSDLPDATADENRLQQILYNLVGNAIKFTAAGKIEISAAIINHKIAISVSDTGIGIPEDKQIRIFESFEQADGSTAREYGGTGLGLAITKKLVELHQGEIAVKSTVGRGSCFTFTLPIYQNKLDKQPSFSEIPGNFNNLPPRSVTNQVLPLLDSKSQLVITSENARKIKILIVDDEPVNLQVLLNHLSLANYNVTEANNGEEALSAIENGFKPDLILLDVMMPKMTGYEVTEKLRQRFSASELPILLLTAKNQIQDLVTGLEVGANDYLNKPISKDELLARIQTHLNLSRLRNENFRLNAELAITQRLQKILLPKPEEISAIKDLEIAGYMEPVKEVGGDYYDVLQHEGGVKISIGDVTGHGLESGVLMLMVQAAIRTLQNTQETDAIKFLDIINRTIYQNIVRMNSDKNMTLAILDYYANGKFCLSGQHEEIIVLRGDGFVEIIETIDLGFPLGLEENITQFIDKKYLHLNSGDSIVVYTDGITEAENIQKVRYGLKRLCQVLCHNCYLSAEKIKDAVVEDVKKHIGKQIVYDDLTLLIIKRR
ncbi:SpoIIE family protein phosphatase [Oscillatoria salina]|uniref:SpoIIE family protein phosphatase n=1 Tax=Oscillatoria salina TaxID=331517 RepID=UPI001CCA0679|nr:SpoIIE family protein phosphatase [Oscillatoria salina]